MMASTLTGDRVVNVDGEDLGKIDEVMVDTRSGRVAYAVLSFGGFLGIGDKLFAILWDQFSLDEENKRLVLDIGREKARERWPDMLIRPGVRAPIRIVVRPLIGNSMDLRLP